MKHEIFDWILLLSRWLHITVAVTWIGTSIFFMWLDRSFETNLQSNRPGHTGELWMVHGGGFYHVEKLLMGPTKVPEKLHWFKWESYWTWMSGMILIILHYYLGDGTFLLDTSVSDISYSQGVIIGLFSIFGSWFCYDFIWENKITKSTPQFGHIFTLLWFGLSSYFLCKTLSGRAAYIHLGAMLGTWMTANVFLRIIPRQIKMVEASKLGFAINPDWAKNAKNRSTHNTYFTLPVIFIMLSNHFPNTYGHDYNWVILLIISAAGAAIREYFISRLKNPKRSIVFGALGISLLSGTIIFSRNNFQENKATYIKKNQSEIILSKKFNINQANHQIYGIVRYLGEIPEGKKLQLPPGCVNQHRGSVYSNELMVKNKRIENVLVRIVKGHEHLPKGQPPSSEVILDQKGCIYTPRVVTARVGQKVTFINSDPIFHNVRSVTNLNQKFNLAMPRKDQRETKIFRHPELFLQAKCSVHPWMGAYIAILDHPYFSLTNSQGEFSISSLMPGQYELEVWHEKFGSMIKKVTIQENKKLELNIELEGLKL